VLTKFTKRMHLSVAFFFSLASVVSLAQSGYKLDFKVTGWKDTTVYLGYYYGEQTNIKDTARANTAGAFYFDNKTTLPQGVYFLVLKTKTGFTKIFDFVISKDQFFSMETTTDDYIRHMVVQGDEDNKLFFDNMRFNMERNNEAEPYVKIVRDSALADDQKKPAREALEKINEKVMAHQKQLVASYPQTMTARLLKVTMPVDIPPAPQKANGSIDSTFQLRYYREHFFDNFDLADDALLRLPRPFYQEKIKEYLNKLYAPLPDTILHAIDKMVAKAKRNPETYKYLVWNCIYLYQNPEIMGLDAVFVALYDKFIASGEMNYWISDQVKKNVKDYAEKLRPSLVGKTGANLIMQDQNFQPRSMYDIKNKYTILFIFDPDCSHCKEETPKLVDFYHKSKAKFDFEVYAVSSDTSMQKMRDYIKTMKMPWITVNGPRSYLPKHYSELYHAETTPSLYILDRQHKIIAKKLPVKQLEDFFSKHEKFLQANPPKKATGS
jgi:thiol-disulfide isomerase/thioredoxin